jgi:hypothetical protein
MLFGITQAAKPSAGIDPEYIPVGTIPGIIDKMRAGHVLL